MSPQNRRQAVPKELEKGRRALRQADALLGGSEPDGAVSRAYYAAFHAARAALLTLGVQPRSHKGVNERFNLDLVQTGKVEAEYLSLLGRVQAKREVADYVIEAELTNEQAGTEVEAARRFLERIERFLREDGWIG